MSSSPANILCFSGLDPSGGAGIQADIESIASMGGHALPIITALTVQDTQNVSRFETVNVELFTEQARKLLEDVDIQAIKIGMVASVGIIEAIHTILSQHPNVPVIYDPVISAGGGGDLSDSSIIEAIRSQLVPLTTLLTPNSPEARLLSSESDLVSCGKHLLETGCKNVLVTGTHENAETVDNLWFNEGQHLETFSWERLPYEYHGSGCTLASAIAALMAQGLDPFIAANEAQDYSWNTLKNAYLISSKGQYIPNRFYWAHGDE